MSTGVSATAGADGQQVTSWVSLEEVATLRSVQHQTLELDSAIS